jgi:redox-sensitive bicupin YhaK (pirin superfamily)
MGNGSVIQAGDVQRMTAGTGVFHSEFNHSADQSVHLLQIWILPRKSSLQPGYEQQHFTREDKLNQWRLVASSDGRDASMTVHQAVDLYASVLEAGNELQHSFAEGHSGYLQVVSGSVAANGEKLDAGDGAAIHEIDSLTMTAITDAEAILFDMGLGQCFALEWRYALLPSGCCRDSGRLYKLWRCYCNHDSGGAGKQRRQPSAGRGRHR